ncbi:MAG: DNA polymerase IV [Deltaproteobacteria bacterium]|nr:DNA polymerase IV [Deltaproteobacteria bacterium]MBW2359879.1 DNA polymerase IV [Deltaproteobacteria bacterium]
MTRARVLFAEVPCFYAAIECSQHPELRGRPVIVGGDPRKRGLVQAASPDALEAGVALDMPLVEALRLCPRARAVRTDMALYRDLSRQLLACLRRVFAQLEPFGLAAAYFAVPVSPDPEVSARLLAERVRQELGLPLRVGIASAKFVARVAAEEAGAEGVLSVAEGAEREFLRPLGVERLDGVGRKTAAALAELGAVTIGEVQRLGRERLEEVFGTHGLRIFSFASALDDSPVRASRHPQSLSRELTLPGEVLDRAVIGEQLLELARQLEGELARQGLAAGRVGVKVRFVDQGTQSRSRALSELVVAAGDLHAVALGLLDRTEVGSRRIRGLGLQLGKLAAAAEADRQLDLFFGGR